MLPAFSDTAASSPAATYFMRTRATVAGLTSTATAIGLGPFQGSAAGAGLALLWGYIATLAAVALLAPVSAASARTDCAAVSAGAAKQPSPTCSTTRRSRMVAIRIAIARIRALFRRDATTDEIRDELQFHVQMRADEYAQQGLDARD